MTIDTRSVAAATTLETNAADRAGSACMRDRRTRVSRAIAVHELWDLAVHATGRPAPRASTRDKR